MPPGCPRPACLRQLVPLVAAAAIPLAALRAHAQSEPVPVHIDYTAPSECPALDQLFAAVRARTPIVTPASPSDARRAFRVAVRTDRSGARAEVSDAGTARGAAVRVVEGASCSEVIDALGLTIALAVDPEALVRSSGAAAPPAPEPTAPASSPAPETTGAPPPVAAGDDAPAHGRVGAGPVVTRLVDAGPSWGARVFAEVRVAVRGPAVRLTATGTAARSDEALFRAALLGLSVSPVRLSLGRLALSPGAELEGGLLRGESRGLALDHTQGVSRSWWGAAALLRVEVSLHRWLALELEAATSLPFVKRRFVVEQPPRQIAETHSPALRGAAAVSVPF